MADVYRYIRTTTPTAGEQATLIRADLIDAFFVVQTGSDYFLWARLGLAQYPVGNTAYVSNSDALDAAVSIAQGSLEFVVVDTIN